MVAEMPIGRRSASGTVARLKRIGRTLTALPDSGATLTGSWPMPEEIEIDTDKLRETIDEEVEKSEGGHLLR